MLKRWIKSWVQPRKETLGDILSSEEGREVLLNEKRIVSLDPTSIRRDAARIVRYAETHDYQAFAKETYLDLIDAIDKLCKPDLTDPEVDYLRGRMAQTLDILKISYRAHRKLQERNETKT